MVTRFNLAQSLFEDADGFVGLVARQNERR
jgi:hypothetical protein